MSKPIAIITGDWHLTDRAWKWRPNLSGDALFGLKQIVAVAEKYRLPILSAGDMFDTKRPPLDILLQTRSLLSATGGVFIQGNHDKAATEYGSWFSMVAPSQQANGDAAWINADGTNPYGRTGPLLEEIVNHDGYLPIREKLLDNAQLEIEPAHDQRLEWYIDGIDYVETREQLQDRLNSLEAQAGDRNPASYRQQILMLHQGCTQIFGVGECELDHDMIPDCYDFVICGHFHKALLTKIRTKSGKEIPCLSPGGTHLLSIVEDPIKRLYFLCDDGAVYSKRLITRRVIKTDMQDATEAQIRESLNSLVLSLKQESKAKRPPELETPIVSVIYNSNTVESLKSLYESVLKNEGIDVHLFFKDVSDKDAYEVEVASGLESETTIETGFHYAKDIFRKSEIDPRIRQIVESMLDNEPSQEVYDNIKTQFLTNYA